MIKEIFFFIGFTAVTTSSSIKILQVTQTSWIFSIGRNDAGPTGLNKSRHQIYMGFEYVFYQHAPETTSRMSC